LRSRIEMLESRGGLMEKSHVTKRGRRDSKAIPDSFHAVPCDVIIPAIGTGNTEVLTKTFPELMLNKKGYILADENGYASVEGVFGAGDIMACVATVIEVEDLDRVAAWGCNQVLRTGSCWMARPSRNNLRCLVESSREWS